MKIKKICSVTSILLMIFVLTGCSSANTAKTQNKELKEVNVLLDWYPNAVHTFLYAAQAQGYFEEAGLKVNLITPASTDDGIKLVAAGKADIAISYPKQEIIARGENINVKSIGAIVRSPLNQLMVRKDSNVNTLKDLENKKVGYSSFDLDKETVKSMVQKAGGDPNKVEFIDVGYDLMTAIQTKRVDAIIGGFINHEKILLEKEGVELNTFNSTDYGMPKSYELSFIASDDKIANDSDTLKAFLSACKKGFDYTKNNEDSALKLVLDSQNDSYPLDSETEKKSLDTLLPLMETSDGDFLSQSSDNFTSNIDWLTQTGILKNKVNADDVYTELNR